MLLAFGCLFDLYCRVMFGRRMDVDNHQDKIEDLMANSRYMRGLIRDLEKQCLALCRRQSIYDKLLGFDNKDCYRKVLGGETLPVKVFSVDLPGGKIEVPDEPAIEAGLRRVETVPEKKRK